MLPSVTLPPSLASLVQPLRSCFTAPSFVTFCALLVGHVAAVHRRTVCGMWIAAGLSRLAHHGRAHWFFARARWCPDTLGLTLATLIVDMFLPADAAVEVVVDDTLFRRYGRKVHAAGWQHDGAAQGTRKFGYGNCWVIVGIVLRLPVPARPVCLPVLFRLWRPKQHVSKVDHAAALVTMLAGTLGRRLHVTGDAAYHGPACKTLPPDVTWTCRLQRNAVLQDIAGPRRAGQRGRPRLKGPRLGTPADLAETLTWKNVTIERYGQRDTIGITTRTCLWYGAFGTRQVRIILVREPATTGYDLALVTTDLHTPPAQVVARYAARWSIETTIANAKQLLGVGQARNRVPRAVERTVPFGLITLSIVTVWYTRHGYHSQDINDRAALSPWYTTKTEPAFEDMLTKLRRTLIAARFSPTHPAQPTPEEIQEVQRAWAAAAA
ncbi:IS701 family transposase [Micromonospora sp. NPDC003197]